MKAPTWGHLHLPEIDYQDIIYYADPKKQADTGTKMIHLGRNTRSRIVSKGISAGLNSSGKSVWGNEIEIMGQ